MAEYTLPDGRTLVVGPFGMQPDGQHWSCWVPGESEFPVNGYPLNKTIAAAAGYSPNPESWPSWIDDFARQIEALPRPAEIDLADISRDGYQIASHDYRVVFWTEKPSEHIFAALDYDIRGAQDVHEVIEWAEKEAGPHDCYTIFVKVESPWSSDHGLVHIAGLDPSVSPEHMTFLRRHPLRRNSELPPES